MKKNLFDIIVIGSGISGLNFALRAAETKQKVLVITKKRVAQSSTNFAQGGIAAVLSQLDDYKKHVHDTLVAGCFHNNKKAVEYMVKHGPSAVMRLMELGVPFATQDGELLLTREGGHTERRIAFVSDYTGQAIEKVLVQKVRKNPYITLYEHAFAADLLVHKKKCYGVKVIRKENKTKGKKAQEKIEHIFGKKIVLATGGAGQLFSHTTNPSISTGDGLAMASRVGCQFCDVEFVQFHPTALNIKGKPAFLISEAMRGEGAHLVNVERARFMKKYHHMGELAPRDVVSRAIFEEEKNGPVYLDIRHEKASLIKARFPQIYKKLKSYGIDMTRDLIPISPAAHYICGGIKVNLKGETGIKNLYAFGEVAWTGVHGANRLASNSLLEALVFSDRILAKTHEKLSHHVPHFKKESITPLSSFEQKIVRRVKTQLQKSMWENVGIVRSKKSLNDELQLINSWEKDLYSIKKNNRELLEVKNMVLSAQLITKAARARPTSLGCHFRYN